MTLCEVVMIALKITNVKQFMGKLLGGEDFDSFLLERLRSALIILSV